MNQKIDEVITIIDDLLDEGVSSKLVQSKLSLIKKVLADPVDIALRVDRARSILDELDEDPHVPMVVRTELWNIAAMIESL